MTDTIFPSAQDRNRALALATFAFAVCFAVWTLFSIIGLSIKQQLGLSDTQFGLLVATPVLTGSVSRLFLGLWTERLGGRVVFPLQMLTTAIAVWLLTWAGSYPVFLLAALGLGLAGGSFIVGVSYVSRWYPAARQGTALGIYGVGNIGAAVTNLGAPFLVVALGWEDTARLYALVLAATAGLFWLLARTDPRHAAHRADGSALPTVRQQLAPLKNMQVWRFSAYYFFVFGGFVALASFLPRYYSGAWGLPLTTAGLLAGLYSLPGALFRALGGWMSDRWGARAVLYRVFGLSMLALLVMAYPGGRYTISGISGPITFELGVSLPLFVVLTVLLGFLMSLGSAAVFKHIPVYYPDHVGAVGGLVGMIGGLGGFFLPIAFGLLLDATGIWTMPFLLMLLVVAATLAWMHRSVRNLDQKPRRPASDVARA
ncbi:MAG: nitrate/nitrite transporter [Paracoccaceae bacterium]|nr:nitrate/nitrite transporter [Paracoccaceae bacterium]